MAKVIYTAKATVTGGRQLGHGVSDDGALDVQLRPRRTAAAPNPEQLFAVGYAACFESAMGAVGRRERLEVGDVSIDSSVSLLPTEERGFKLGVELDVSLPQLDAEAGREGRPRRASRVPVLERHAREHRREADRERPDAGLRRRDRRVSQPPVVKVDTRGGLPMIDRASPRLGAGFCGAPALLAPCRLRSRAHRRAAPRPAPRPGSRALARLGRGRARAARPLHPSRHRALARAGDRGPDHVPVPRLAVRR